MELKCMALNEFEHFKTGQKVVFGRMPEEGHTRAALQGLTEFKEYRVIGKYHEDPRGPVLKTLKILDDNDIPRDVHYQFFLFPHSKAS